MYTSAGRQRLSRRKWSQQRLFSLLLSICSHSRLVYVREANETKRRTKYEPIRFYTSLCAVYVYINVYVYTSAIGNARTY
jgi:hypothetical protein